MLTDRYTRPEMGHIWSEQRKFETWLEVELAAADVMAEEEIIPADAARDLRAKSTFTIERIDEIEKQVKHDVIAFTQTVAENVGEAGRFLHFGLTSYDVVDTALGLRLRESADLILSDIDAFLIIHGCITVWYERLDHDSTVEYALKTNQSGSCLSILIVHR